MRVQNITPTVLPDRRCDIRFILPVCYTFYSNGTIEGPVYHFTNKQLFTL